MTRALNHQTTRQKLSLTICHLLFQVWQRFLQRSRQFFALIIKSAFLIGYMLRKMLNVEKLKFEFYHIHWMMIDVYNFDNANLKLNLCLTFPCATVLAKSNLDNRSSLGYVKCKSLSKRVLIIFQSCLSNTHLWSKIYTTRGVQFYHKRTWNTLLSSLVYAYTILSQDIKYDTTRLLYWLEG